LTVGEDLSFYAGAYGVGRQDQAATLARVGLQGYGRERTKTLSTGWRQRLALAIAIGHRPRLPFLDEPTSGVDPNARRSFWDLIDDLAAEGVTVLVTTHYRDEAEDCGRVGIMREGRLLAIDTPTALKRDRVQGAVCEVVARPLLQALDALKAAPAMLRVTLAGDHLRVLVSHGAGDTLIGRRSRRAGSLSSRPTVWSRRWRMCFWRWGSRLFARPHQLHGAFTPESLVGIRRRRYHYSRRIDMEPSNFENQIYPYTPVAVVPPQRRGWSALQALAVVALVAFAALGGGVAGSALTARVVLTMMPRAQPVAAVQPIAQKPLASEADIPVAGGSQAGAVYRKVGGSVVEISAGGTGSGIVVDSSGLIITNYHVVASVLRSRNQKITVRFGNGETRTAKLTQSDQANDLAVLKVDLPAGVPVATLADSDSVAVGDFIVAIGNPFGLDGTITQGIVSSVNRSFGGQTALIQVDAAINPGNSGGPLLNGKGEVIGINSMIASPVRGSVGIGFAVPINIAKLLLN